MTRTPLILVPGLMCDHAVWSPILPALNAVADCQIADHGDTDRIERMAQRVLDHAPEHFALAGHSMGGRVALEVARLAPQRVLRLALMSTGHLPRPSGSAGEDEARKRYALLEIARKQGVRAMAQDWVRGMVHPDRLSDAPLIESILAMFARKTAADYARQIHALLERPDASAVLRQLHCPTLFVCGQEDTWSPISQHQAMAQLVPGSQAQVAVIPHSGHMCLMEDPTAVALALTQWLAA
jgi:pimeloyl-ACP methyl ester carboxylesterase